MSHITSFYIADLGHIYRQTKKILIHLKKQQLAIKVACILLHLVIKTYYTYLLLMKIFIKNFID